MLQSPQCYFFNLCLFELKEDTTVSGGLPNALGNLLTRCSSVFADSSNISSVFEVFVHFACPFIAECVSAELASVK